MDFSYEIDPNMKIGTTDVGIQKKSGQSNTKEFEELKQKVGGNAANVFEYTEKGKTPKSPEEEDQFDREDGGSAEIEYGFEQEEEEEKEYIKDYYGNQSGAQTHEKLPEAIKKVQIETDDI